jgi:hypothetical protein
LQRVILLASANTIWVHCDACPERVTASAMALPMPVRSAPKLRPAGDAKVLDVIVILPVFLIAPPSASLILRRA